MYTKYKKINSSGFTLIEIIASIALLGTIVAVMLPIFPQIMSWNQDSESELVASNLLSKVAYDIKNDEAILQFIKDEEIGVCGEGTPISYSYAEGEYKVELNICKEQDSLNLYRTRIDIKLDNRPISQSFTYVNGENND
ncbi:type II secretion system protein [Oceanobacillus halophilus]|uniref:Type II secretion system protein n=1 Tax=Oceanobacillus halophilus TaxID=930130 RepID=A0A494ZUA8_9BACI|nr:type II secretion system protein [Oceanobacillus halophilus]RKQ29884.1 type II secretion system protein [Oceanobacillus halophilus]